MNIVEKKTIEEFWIHKLSGYNTRISFPWENKSSEKLCRKKCSFNIDPKLHQKLVEFCNYNESAFQLLFISILRILLYKSFKTEDAVIASNFDNGNLFLFRDSLNAENTLKDVLISASKVYSEAYAYCDYSFEDLINNLKNREDSNTLPLCQIVCLFGTSNLNQQFLLKNNLLIKTIKSNNRLDIEVEYNSNLCYSDDLAISFFNNFLYLIANFKKNININIQEINFLREDEEVKILNDFNNTSCYYPKNKTIIDLYEDQVKLNSNKVALIFQDTFLTYNEFDKRVNQISSYLVNNGIKKGDIIGLMADRSLEMMIGIFAIFKIGCTYLPMTSNYPKDRVNYMLENSKAKAVLCQKQYKDIFSPAMQVLLFESEKINSYSTSFNNIKCDANDIAYIIYTSGSTGTPKGVMIEHHSLVNRIHWMGKNYPVNKQDVFLQKTTIAFDVSVWELFWWSISGSSLFILNPEEEKLPDRIIKAIEKNAVSVIHFVPSMLRVFLDELEGESEIQQIKTLKYVFASGEALHKNDVSKFNKWLLETNKTKLINLYGPTEATIDVSYFNCYDKEYYDLIPIGKPIDNTKLFILDEQNNILPVGIIGELCIAGAGLAKGYINNEKLTQGRFYYLDSIQERIYRTGDLARLLPDGNIDYIDRIDNQVKIRGNRIELGEIENQLIKYNGIKEAIVVLKNRNGIEAFLCAYYTGKKDIEQEKLREHLSVKLPGYMIPPNFVFMKQFPLTKSGKVSINDLPDPVVNRNADYIPPKGKIEIKLSKNWETILGIENIGRNDNYFSLGGDSIQMVQIASKMYSEGYKLSAHDFYKFPTIGTLAGKVKPLSSEINQELVIGNFPLTPIQRLFYSYNLEFEYYFNQAVFLTFNEVIDESLIKKIFLSLQEHHDSLRIVFKNQDGLIVQRNEGNNHPLSIETFDYTNKEYSKSKIVQQANKIQQSIELNSGPLMKLGLFRFNTKTKLLIVIHHLVIDTVSWRIIFEDINTLLIQYKKNKDIKLPLKTDSYSLWSNKIEEYAKKIDKKVFEYWNSVSLQETQYIDKDNLDGTNYYKDTITKKFVLNELYTNYLIKKVPYAFNTNINEILISSLLVAINRIYGINKVKLDIEGHGRNNRSIGSNVNRTVGWFTNIFPVIFNINDLQDLSNIIIDVKENFRNVPNDGFDWNICHLYKSNINNKIENKYISQICFNYLGQFKNEIKDSSFQIDNEYVGNNVHPKNKRNYELDISGFISGKLLELCISYSKYQFNEDTIQKLLDNHKTALIEIIDLCRQQKLQRLTPSDFTYNKLSKKEVEELQDKYNIQNIYSLSPLQEGILFHSISDSNSSAYNATVSYAQEDSFDINLLELTLKELIDRHDILRTIFLYEKYSRPFQLVQKEGTVNFEYNDISTYSEKEQYDYLTNIKTDIRHKYQFDKDSFLKLNVVKKEENIYEFIWNLHHIIVDGWSCSILIKEFLKIYNSLLSAKSITSKSINQYGSYIQWLDQQDKTKMFDYWKDYLRNYDKSISLPKNPSFKDGDNNYELSEFKLSLNRNKTSQLVAKSKQFEVTLNSIFETLWGIILGFYNNTNDVVFGKVVAGRPAEVENISEMIGIFINTIPVRVAYDKNLTLKKLMQKVQKQSALSDPNVYCSLAEIQSSHPLGSNLIDHILVFENYPAMKDDKSMDNQDSYNRELKDFKYVQQTNYYLNVVLVPDEEINIEFQYNKNQIEHEIIKNLAQHIEFLVDQTIENADFIVSKLTFLNPIEKHTIINTFNNTQFNFANNKTIIELFEIQAERVPNNIALTLNDVNISYNDLNNKANQVGKLLRRKGIKPNDKVAVILDRSIEMLIGILAIMKSGGAYLPIDPNYPMDRKKFILENSNVKLILTQKKLIDDIPIQFETIDIKNIDYILSEFQNLEKVNNSNDLAYVIYTSGSTGNPKGVMIEHCSVVNLIQSQILKFGIQEDEKILMLSAYYFDASVEQMFLALSSGASLVLLEKETVFNNLKLNQLIENNCITHLHTVPALLENISVENKHLKRVIAGGDICPVKLADRWYKRCKFYNEYGPTETTVTSIEYLVKEIGGNNISISIGKPINNTKAYIVDSETLNIQPIGVPGELFIGGAGIMRGYLNDENLTQTKVINNPFGEGKVYKTGDLARWLPDGNLEYLGRIDNQVKIRGLRIELGEIEYYLNEIAEIKEAIVVVVENNGDKLLVAYCVIQEEIDRDYIKRYLRNKIPDYMVPSYIVYLDSMPLNQNGKINKKNLPFPELKIDDDYIPPRNDIEKKVVDIWAEALGLDQSKISVNKNFFDLGGNSIKMISVNGKINHHFKKVNSLIDMFKYTTIEAISNYILDNHIDEINEIKDDYESNFNDIINRRLRRRSL